MRGFPILFSALWAFLLFPVVSSSFSEDSSPGEPAVEAGSAPPATPEDPAAPAAKASCPADAAGPELVGCMLAFDNVTAGLRDAHRGFQQWTAEASGQVAALAKKEGDLEARFLEAKAQTGTLEAESGKADKKRKKEISQQLKQLAKDSKQLEKDAARLRKERAALCVSLSKTAGEKVKATIADLKARLDQAQTDIRR